jgi:hypothetical protein
MKNLFLGISLLLFCFILSSNLYGIPLLLGNLPSTNIVTSAGTLAPTSNATNYTVNLSAGEQGNIQQIFLANTNVYLSFTGTNVFDNGRTIIFNGWTNSVVSTITLNLQFYHSNGPLSLFVTNGYSAVFTFYCPDGSGTNIMVSDGGRWR